MKQTQIQQLFNGWEQIKRLVKSIRIYLVNVRYLKMNSNSKYVVNHKCLIGILILQAIHARSLFPCSDTPAVKFTYDAKVSVHKPLVVLMSAVKKDKLNDISDSVIQYEFEQKVRIPSYLVAIVAGDLVSK